MLDDAAMCLRGLTVWRIQPDLDWKILPKPPDRGVIEARLLYCTETPYSPYTLARVGCPANSPNRIVPILGSAVFGCGRLGRLTS